MCQEVHVADIRTALLDCYDDGEIECTQVEDLLAELQTPIDHAVANRRRAHSADTGDDRAP